LRRSLPHQPHVDNDDDHGGDDIHYNHDPYYHNVDKRWHDDNRWFDNQSGFIDHADHHNPGGHIDDVNTAVNDAADLDQLRNNFIDALAEHWTADPFHRDIAASAAALTAAALTARNRQ
jgi:hypothetical protein